MEEKNKKRKTFADIRIKFMQGVKFDEILGWTFDPVNGATVRYSINGKERLISLESEAIEIELITNV